ncbi:hypothetical protein Hanom_Chr14g01272241 [Helianthus anomalus]
MILFNLITHFQQVVALNDSISPSGIMYDDVQAPSTFFTNVFTLKIEADEENPGKFIVSFTFDATVACSITLYFFAKEGDNCNLTSIKEDSISPITLNFQQGLGQRFRQTLGTGIDLSAYDESELSKRNDTSVYLLAMKAEATPSSPEDGKQYPSVTNSQPLFSA